MRPIFDQRDQQLKDRALALWEKRTGPRVGDFLEMPNGRLHRFTHDWGDQIQITSHYYPHHGSFYFGQGGTCSYSGGLDPGFPKASIEATERVLQGPVWMFHHGYAAAHNGVPTTIPCRVFRLTEPPANGAPS